MKSWDNLADAATPGIVAALADDIGALDRSSDGVSKMVGFSIPIRQQRVSGEIEEFTSEFYDMLGAATVRGTQKSRKFFKPLTPAVRELFYERRVSRYINKHHGCGKPNCRWSTTFAAVNSIEQLEWKKIIKQ
ncbi:hypothetical protein [Bradyrhizobium ivorense]|uniref:hypothetical protein n=1 Tax=Bradyrhizobium ivorense TaxID=2511166 RepID=UPI00155A4CE3|nr:hypothetical protein [Bradyrhizobium ivorense]